MLVTDCHCTVIEDTWKEIAITAWSGYLNDGRGLVQVAPCDSRAQARAQRMFYQPLRVLSAEDEIALVNDYDPNQEVIVCVIDDEGRHACKACHPELTPPAAYAHASRTNPALLA